MQCNDEILYQLQMCCCSRTSWRVIRRRLPLQKPCCMVSVAVCRCLVSFSLTFATSSCPYRPDLRPRCWHVCQCTRLQGCISPQHSHHIRIMTSPEKLFGNMTFITSTSGEEQDRFGDSITKWCRNAVHKPFTIRLFFKRLNAGLCFSEIAAGFKTNNSTFVKNVRFQRHTTFELKIDHILNELCVGWFYLIARINKGNYRDLSHQEWKSYTPKDWHIGTVLLIQNNNLRFILIPNRKHEAKSPEYEVRELSYDVLQDLFVDMYTMYYFSSEPYDSKQSTYVRRHIQRAKPEYRDALHLAKQKRRKIESNAK